jgi:hypothetical protein
MEFVIYSVVDARNYVAPGADRPPAAARALAEYIVRLLPPIVSINKSSGQNHKFPLERHLL